MGNLHDLQRFWDIVEPSGIDRVLDTIAIGAAATDTDLVAVHEMDLLGDTDKVSGTRAEFLEDHDPKQLAKELQDRYLLTVSGLSRAVRICRETIIKQQIL